MKQAAVQVRSLRRGSSDKLHPMRSVAHTMRSARSQTPQSCSKSICSPNIVSAAGAAARRGSQGRAASVSGDAALARRQLLQAGLLPGLQVQVQRRTLAACCSLPTLDHGADCRKRLSFVQSLQNFCCRPRTVRHRCGPTKQHSVLAAHDATRFGSARRCTIRMAAPTRCRSRRPASRAP